MKLLILLFGMVLLSCGYQQDFTVKVKINNMSDIECDSIRLYVYPNNEKMFYKVKPGQKIDIDFEYKDFEYKRGEALASGITIFKGNEFYVCQNGLIDIPYATLEDNYQYFIYNDYTSYELRDKNYKPNKLPKKHKLSDYPNVYE